jgi:phage terminase large subunit
VSNAVAIAAPRRSRLLEALVAHKSNEPITSDSIRFPTPQFSRVEFFEMILGRVPTSAQVEIFEALDAHDRVAVYSGRHVGKSTTGGGIALHHFCSHEDATVAIVSASEPQLREITFHDLIAMYHSSGRCFVCRLQDPDGPRPCPHSACIDGDLYANIRSGLRTHDDRRRIFGRAPRDPDFARGLGGVNLLIIVDEASGVPDDVFDVLDGHLAGGGKLIAFGQPTTRAGWFFKANIGELEFHVLTIDSRSTPNVKLGRVVVPGLADKEWCERKEREWGEEDARFDSEVRGRYPSRDATRLLSDVEIAAAFERHATVSDVGDLQFGIDPAGGGGGDRSVIVARRGAKILDINPFDGGTDVICAMLVQMLARWRHGARERWHVNFDGSSSFGADLGQALRKWKLRDDFFSYEALDMKGGTMRTDHVLRQSKCSRRVDAYWLNASIMLKTTVGVPFDAELREEFLFAEWEQDRDGGTRLRDKRSFRKLIGRSPDVSDAVCFALWDGKVAAMSEAARPGPGEEDGGDDDEDAPAVRPPSAWDDNGIRPSLDDSPQGPRHEAEDEDEWRPGT